MTPTIDCYRLGSVPSLRPRAFPASPFCVAELLSHSSMIWTALCHHHARPGCAMLLLQSLNRSFRSKPKPRPPKIKGEPTLNPEPKVFSDGGLHAAHPSEFVICTAEEPLDLACRPRVARGR